MLRSNALIHKKPWERKCTDQEKEALLQVKDIRRGYLNSKDMLVIRDYGAGKKRSQRSAEEMEKGVIFTRPISKICRSSATTACWGRLIFKLIREFQPIHCLELGTNLGISAAYQIVALKMNNKGSLVTIEGADEMASIANENLKKLDYPNYSVLTGRFNDVLPSILQKDHPFDFVFIDGHHDGPATKNYFEMIFPYLDKPSILIFDDIHWSKGMREAWKEISTDERISDAVDLRQWGICLVKK